jgi:hypothetical protein
MAAGSHRGSSAWHSRQSLKLYQRAASTKASWS